MRSSRVLAVSGIALILSLLLAGCGGSSPKPAPPVATLMITSTSLPTGTVNNPYAFFLQASGGSGTYTWGLASNSAPLPPGLSLNPMTAEISGTPTTPGKYDINAQVTDGAGHTGTAYLSITITGALSISCALCSNGEMPYANTGLPYSGVTFTASGGPTGTTYTWCVVESSGTCDNGAGGALPLGMMIATVNNTGVISGTPTSQPAAPVSVEVQVSDSEQLPSRATASYSLAIFDFEPKSPQAAQLNVPYTVELAALGGVGPYTWTTTGSLPPGLTLGPCVHVTHPTCPLTGTPTQVGTFPFTVSVTDGEATPAMVTGTVTVNVGALANNATLNGQYAIAFTGYNNGTFFIMAASFAADGNGNVTSGFLDRNDGHGSEINDPTQCSGNPNCPVPEIIQASGSSYDLTAGNGLGKLTLATIDHNGSPHTYVFQLAVQGMACKGAEALSACGQLIQADPSNPQTYGSGELRAQDPMYFANWFPVNLAAQITGIDPSGNRYAGAGAIGTNLHTQIDIDCNGNGWGLSGGCPIDIDDNGTAAQDPVSGGQFSGNVDTNTGRGEFINMRFPNDPSLCQGGINDCGYTFYIINKEQAIILSGDLLSRPANLTLWRAFRQESNGTGWHLSNLSGTGILELSALDPNGANPDVSAGIFTADGAGNATFSSDENDGGTLSQQMSSGTYAIDSNGNKSGRVTMSGFSQFGANGAVLYLYAGNYAYFVGTDAKVTSGAMEAQTGSPFRNTSFSGNYEGGSLFPATTSVTNSVAYLFANGSGTASLTENTSNPIGSLSIGLTYQVDSTGRAVLMDQNQNTYGILYVVGPEKVVVVPNGSNPAISTYIAGQPD